MAFLSNQVDVHCFLLTDVLLICKAIAKKGHGTLKVLGIVAFVSDKSLLKRTSFLLLHPRSR